MWLLISFSKVVVAGPFKSQAEMAKRLGVSQQYVNRKIRKGEFSFQLDGKPVIAREHNDFVGGGKKGSDKKDLAMRLGVSKEAVEKVLQKNSSGLLQTPNGKVKIQKLKPGEKQTLPAVRVLWNDDTEKQDFVSFAAAAKELKLHPKTIPSALKAGRDSFTRKADGKKFTFEIPEENTPSRKKPKPPVKEDLRTLVERERQKVKVAEIKRLYCSFKTGFSVPSTARQIKDLKILSPRELAKIMKKYSSSNEHKSPSEELAELKRRPEILTEYSRYQGWDPTFYSLEELDRKNKIQRGELEEESTNPPQSLGENHPEEEETPNEIVVYEEERTQNEIIFSDDEEEEDSPSVLQTALVVAAQSAIALPSKLGGYAAPVDEDPLALLARYKSGVEAQIRKYMCSLPGEEYLGMAQYQDAAKQLKEIERREELYYKMRRKYPGWYLDGTVGELDKTKTVLFNPKTGEDVPVKNYEDIANYFLSNGYVDFLSPKDCDRHWDCGRVEFPAQKVLKAKPEETQEMVACNTTTWEEIREEARERTVKEKTVQENVQDGILKRMIVETETTERATVQAKIVQKVTVEEEPLSTVWWWMFTFLPLE